MMDGGLEVPVAPVDGLPHNGDQEAGHHPRVEGQLMWNHLEEGGREREGKKERERERASSVESSQSSPVNYI